MVPGEITLKKEDDFLCKIIEADTLNEFKELALEMMPDAQYGQVRLGGGFVWQFLPEEKYLKDED